MLSIVIPAYNESLTVVRAAEVINRLLSENRIEHELIFVDDGSSDNTWSIIKAEAEKNEEVRGIHFSRNFGKEAAIMAGLNASIGDCCAVMDCDLQHPPETLLEMYELWKQGYEVVEGQKNSRGNESLAHQMAAKTFYKVISKATGFDMLTASDFKLLDRKAVDVIRNTHEKNAFFRALSSWVGYKTTSVKFDVREREAGESKWSTWGLIKYAVSNITSFSTAPMQIVTILGVVMFFVAIVFGINSLVQKILGTAIGGFTTVIILLLFSSSIIMISLGIIGFYIARIYEEIKGRPNYIVAEKCGKDEGI